MSEETSIVRVDPGSIQLPDFISADDKRGTESIDFVNDAKIPRLALAQKLSPEIDTTHPKFIDGLKEGDAFDTLTGKIYGRAPVEVVIVRADPARYIEFNPRDAGGGIKDFNVPAGDKRTEFTVDKDGKSQKPAATKFLEFLALVGPNREVMAISFKGAGLSVARNINGLLGKIPGPTFSVRWSLTPTLETRGQNKFWGFAYKFLGAVDRPTYERASSAYERFKGKVIETTREGGDEAGADKEVPF